MKAFLITTTVFISFVAALALAAFLIIADTSPMGKMEYLYEFGKLSVFRYTGAGSLNDGEVKMLYEDACTRKCHSRDVVERSAHNLREWEGIIGRMRSANRAPVTKSEARVIVAYLTKRYGSNIPTILTLEGGRYLKKYLWRSDFGESDLYVDIIYTPKEYFSFVGDTSEVEGYRADKFLLFKVYINTHQNKLAPFPLERLSRLKVGEGNESRPLLWKVLYESGDNHHREGFLVFDRPDNNSGSMVLILEDLPGQKERVFQWDLPIPEK